MIAANVKRNRVQRICFRHSLCFLTAMAINVNGNKLKSSKDLRSDFVHILFLFQSPAIMEVFSMCDNHKNPGGGLERSMSMGSGCCMGCAMTTFGAGPENCLIGLFWANERGSADAPKEDASEGPVSEDTSSKGSGSGP